MEGAGAFPREDGAGSWERGGEAARRAGHATSSRKNTGERSDSRGKTQKAGRTNNAPTIPLSKDISCNFGWARYATGTLPIFFHRPLRTVASNPTNTGRPGRETRGHDTYSLIPIPAHSYTLIFASSCPETPHSFLKIMGTTASLLRNHQAAKQHRTVIPNPSE